MDHPDQDQAGDTGKDHFTGKTRIFPDPIALPDTEVEYQRLADFFADRFQGQLKAIHQQYQAIIADPTNIHKQELYQIGLLAQTFRLEISQWLSEAQRLLSNQTSEQLQNVQDQAYSQAEDAKQRKPTATLLNALTEERISAIKRAVEQLTYTRDDLFSIITYAQTVLRTHFKDEVSDTMR